MHLWQVFALDSTEGSLQHSHKFSSWINKGLCGLAVK